MDAHTIENAPSSVEEYEMMIAGHRACKKQFASRLMTVTALPLWLWNRPWQPDEDTFELRMAFTMMLGLLFSLHLNAQDSLMFFVPVTLFYAYLRQRNLPRRAFAAFALICLAVIFISESLSAAASASEFQCWS